MTTLYYNNNPQLKAANVKLEFTPNQLVEYLKCRDDPIHFIKTYCKIISLDDGLIPFKLFDYQINFINTVHDNRRVISMQPRQSGKTQTIAAYLVHYTIFNDNKTVAVLANKSSAAREILSRYQIMYENLPNWLQQGVTTWNKGDIELENGSKVFTAATTADGIRGKSCITGSTKICLLHNSSIYYTSIKSTLSTQDSGKNTTYTTFNLYDKDNRVIHSGIRKTADNVFVGMEAVGSVYSDGFISLSEPIVEYISKYGPEEVRQKITGIFTSYTKASKFIGGNYTQSKIDFSSLWKNDTFLNDTLILSTSGFKRFKGIIKQGVRDNLVRVRFSNGTFIDVTHNHKFFNRNKNWEFADNLKPNTILSRKYVEDVVFCNMGEMVYDAYDVEHTNAYYTNGVISHNCNFLYIDEAAIIPNNIAEEFFTSTYPVISSGETTKIVLTSTPIGYNHFWHFWRGAEEGKNGFIPIKVNYWEHPKRNSAWATAQKQMLGETKFNQEILCSFLGSSSTLIAADVYDKMVAKTHIYSKDGFDVLYPPEKEHAYFLIADTSKGVGGDYSAFTVIDVTEVPYRVVAKYRNNEINPMLYPNVIHSVAKQYNEAYVLIEINSSEQVPYIMQAELEYVNLITIVRTPRGQMVSDGFGGRQRAQYGVVTDKKVKRLGCTTLKAMIENNKLLVEDVDIISEISTFIESDGVYAADEGYHDDLIMTLVLFAWLTNDTYFKELSNINLRETIYKQRMMQMEEDISMLGFFTTGEDEYLHEIVL